MPARRKVLGPVVALLIVAVLALGAVAGWRWWTGRDTTDLQRAMALAPADGERFSFTDWAGVRAELDSDLDADSPTDEVAAMLSEAFDADLGATSALVQSAEVLQARFGFSPASVEWELFSQGAAGAVVILRLPDDAVEDVADRLAHLGYDEPAGETDVWTGSDTLLAGLGSVTPELTHLALDADRGLVLGSDNADYLRGLVEGDDPGLGGLDDDGLDAAVDHAGEPVAAAVYTGDHACGALAMSQADPADAAEADRLVDEAGGVHPLTGFAMGLQPGGDVRVAMALEDGDRARADADARATLAAGPAPGQGGEFADRFALGRVAAEGDVVTMDLEPAPGSYVLSDLSTGPVLFATC
ncbi:hypothetical protein [Nocardioides marmotae]|uniref:hypothetical protein n=1 Tax=Nocardioides marmotae TaxID=2663857 RepID=UPI0012B54C0B|nr:hypothetical protein [Nocardioides marmotae]MBC9735373.1 hypothetical protein [Nocardioides marmotae]MTB86472.1 hypothetical protein [Nocardioides marmotae]